MLTDLDDDFFFEEDKISKSTMEDNTTTTTTPLLPIEALSFDITPICTDPIEPKMGELIAIPPPLTVEAASGTGATNTGSTEESSLTLDTDDSAASVCQLVDDNLLSSDVTATVVYTASAFEADRFTELARQKFELERLGMTVSTKSVVVVKDDTNLIGISIGGGAPLCPCLYIVQVFDGTPAAREGSLESGDELLAINSTSVKGKTKVQVAKMIQTATQQVVIHYNKLHADPERGKSLDIILKKLKHRIVDNMSSNTADTLGLSRAILCNDSLVKRLEELEGTEMMYKGMVDHARRMLKAYYDLLQTYRAFGDCFMRISTREPQLRASEAFRMFGDLHRNLEKDGLAVIKNIKPILDDLGTYLHKAIPDTKLTVRRYMDAKFTYLSYCLKVKEMDDEEHSFAAIQEPLYRVETGNYEYRLILRCRQDARGKFAKLRTDVLEKMELLECKHANDLSKQLRNLLDSLAQLNKTITERMDTIPNLFPIEVDFKDTDFQYKSSVLEPQKLDDNEEEELKQESNATGKQKATNSTHTDDRGDVICGLEAVEQPAPIVNVPAKMQDILSLTDNPSDNLMAETTNENDQLLKDLGLLGIDLSSNSISSTPCINKISTPNGFYDFDLFLNQSSGITTAAAAVAADDTTTQFETKQTTMSAATSQMGNDLMAANALETDLLLQ